MKLLHVDSSVLGENSVSRQLTAAVVAQWRRHHPGVEVRYRDLAAQAPGHLSAEALQARAAEPAQLTPAQREEAERDEALLQEFLDADVIVIGAPMYNFSVPSQLKAWVDRIMVAGRTFRYTENGPVGLAAGKKAVIVSSRGGVYAAGSPAAQALDHQEAYLRAVLGFIGVSEVEVVRAEGVSVSPREREQSIAAALDQVAKTFKVAA